VSPSTTSDEVRALVGATGGGTGPARGRELYDFIRRERPGECLELGFAHGVSTAYLAAGLEANGAGRLTSVDLDVAREREPSAEQLLERAGLDARVSLVYEPTSYNWYLHRRIREQQRDVGVCEPYLDFCFIDGAHRWVDDGLAFFLVDKLLKPGGWLLFDDLTWSIDAQDVDESERALPGVGEVFELLVMGHPSYDHLETDGEWGWARKSTTPNPEVRTVIERDLLAGVQQVVRATRSRLAQLRSS
jgi:predicted O-methyltransferase YrrM